MPAPLAKGIILSISLLVAAGIAVYENPEVRAWLEERRRKIALTLNGFADEFDPERSVQRRASQEDASTREYDSPEIIERRRQARAEIMQKGIMLEQRRKAAQERRETTLSFDDMVDSGGRLRENSQMPPVVTSVEQEPNAGGLRNRTRHMNAVARGSAMANPFDDELGGVIGEKTNLEHEQDQADARQRSATLVPEADLEGNATAHPLDRLSSHASAGQIEDTRTASAAPSTICDSVIMTPTSTQHHTSDQHSQPPHTAQIPAQSYQSIQEWASAASSGPASFYSPPESEHNYQNLDASMHTPSTASSTTASLIGTNDLASTDGDHGVADVSDAGVDTPSSWSEIGSQISED